MCVVHEVYPCYRSSVQQLFGFRDIIYARKKYWGVGGDGGRWTTLQRPPATMSARGPAPVASRQDHATAAPRAVGDPPDQKNLAASAAKRPKVRWTTASPPSMYVLAARKTAPGSLTRAVSVMEAPKMRP